MPAKPQVWVFGLCCLFVMVVSVHDATLVVVNHEVIYDAEQNPVGRWLLEVQEGKVWLFVMLKLIGTALACTVLIKLNQYSKRFGMITAGALAILQSMLLCYLTLA